MSETKTKVGFNTYEIVAQSSISFLLFSRAIFSIIHDNFGRIVFFHCCLFEQLDRLCGIMRTSRRWGGQMNMFVDTHRERVRWKMRMCQSVSVKRCHERWTRSRNNMLMPGRLRVQMLGRRIRDTTANWLCGAHQIG